MSFIIDKQTLDDLNLLGRYRSSSVFNLFSKTVTHGASRVAEAMFGEPFTDVEAINERSGIIDFFKENKSFFPFDNGQIEKVELYLSNPAHPAGVVAVLNSFRRKFLSYISASNEYDFIYGGMCATVSFLRQANAFLDTMLGKELPAGYLELLKSARRMLAAEPFGKILAAAESGHLPVLKAAIRDYRLRGSHIDTVNRILKIIYDLDVYITAANTAKEHGFCLPRALPRNGKNSIVSIANIRHPLLPKGVPNTLLFSEKQNTLFLTGANMAGKSTLMKSFGIAVYLAHTGFPVPADRMEFSPMDGMYTSINVPDNMAKGLSHFYAEVLRVKTVSEKVASGKRLVVIFDELFKGTNVKDALDATVGVTKAFSAYKGCAFIVSSHIIEAGEALAEKAPDIEFAYLPTVMKENGRPSYTYKLEKGITGDRHGMMIIHNEQIIETIEGAREVR